jgi:hypothetical protein
LKDKNTNFHLLMNDYHLSFFSSRTIWKSFVSEESARKSFGRFLTDITTPVPGVLGSGSAVLRRYPVARLGWFG